MALRERDLLLVLDNCEHLLDGCAQLVDLVLRAWPEVQVLATSREALGLTGEIAWRVPSLPVPDPQQLPPLGELEVNPAVQLFVERAGAVQPRFVLTEQNAAAVAEVCQRLDGIPLALELAAARIEALTVDQLAARLDQCFRLLTGGNRVALPRQQTLQATLDWSYDLLTDTERCLFNRLSVFAGGWTLEAAERVCAGEGTYQEDVLDLLQRLVRKSLVVAEEGSDGAERYRLLETLRQYAHERLTAAAELATVQGRHADYYRALAEAVAPRGRVQGWSTQLLTEHDNLRTALQWLSEHDAVEEAVRLAGWLHQSWAWGGFLTEGRRELRALLALPAASQSSSEWAQTFGWVDLGGLPHPGPGRSGRAQFGQPAPQIRLLSCPGSMEFYSGDYAAARANLEQAVAVQRTLGDPQLADALSFLGQVAREQADYPAAQRRLEESLALSQAAENHLLSAGTHNRLGTIAHALGDYRLARTRYEASLTLARQASDNAAARTWIAWALHNLGCLALDQEEYATARCRLAESLKSRVNADELDSDKIGFVHGLAEFAVLAAVEGDASRRRSGTVWQRRPVRTRTSRSLGNVFEQLFRAHVGDLVEVFDGTERFDYRVVEVHAVSRTDVSVLLPTESASVSLITCTGVWNAALHDYMERLVVRAELNG